MKKSVPTIPLRRKREQKTNYRKRIALIKSNKNRLVVRKSNKYLTAQIVSYSEKGDNVIKGVHSKELLKQGWKHSCKNIPAAYLTGLLLANKMKDQKNKECVVDFGLQIPLKGNSKMYALIKGAVDGGLKMPLDESVLPSDKQVIGFDDNMKKTVESLKKKLIA
jgi:large subunit ribosomal protein L18